MQLGDHPLGKSITAVWVICLDGARPSVIANQHPVPFQGWDLGTRVTPVPISAYPEHTKAQFSSFFTSVISHLLEKMGKIYHFCFKPWIFHSFGLIPEQMAAAAARRPLMASVKVIWNNHNTGYDLLQFMLRTCKCFHRKWKKHIRIGTGVCLMAPNPYLQSFTVRTAHSST